jgi:daunorubicin resistance ABC transporter ATP-binding subunit
VAAEIADSPAVPAIEADQLTKRYGDVDAVAGVSFSVAPGEIFGYLGRNGSGKTTTVRMLTTLTRPTSGRARVGGVDVAETRRVRRLIGVTMQDAALDDAMTGWDHLCLVAGLSGLGRAAARRRAADLLDLVALTDVARSRIGTYSGGMKRRLDIASALIGRPSVLFLDEPTTGLDPQSRRAVWDEVRTLRASGVTVFLTTQYIEEADQLSDRVSVVDRGAIIAEGAPSRLKAAHGRTTITLAHDGDPAAIARVLDGDEAGIDVDPAGRATITLEASSTGDRALQVLDRIRAAGVSPTHLTVTETSLEDVFVRLTGAAIGTTSGAGGDR